MAALIFWYFSLVFPEHKLSWHLQRHLWHCFLSSHYNECGKLAWQVWEFCRLRRVVWRHHSSDQILYRRRRLEQPGIPSWFLATTTFFQQKIQRISHKMLENVRRIRNLPYLRDSAMMVDFLLNNRGRNNSCLGSSLFWYSQILLDRQCPTKSSWRLCHPTFRSCSVRFRNHPNSSEISRKTHVVIEYGGNVFWRQKTTSSVSDQHTRFSYLFPVTLTKKIYVVHSQLHHRPIQISWSVSFPRGWQKARISWKKQAKSPSTMTLGPRPLPREPELPELPERAELWKIRGWAGREGSRV